MTIARGAAISALIAAVVAVALLMFGGGGGHKYKILFQSAGQLVKGNQVQVGGKGVGNVTDIALTENNQAEITVKVNDDFAPLHEGTTAVIRTVSLPSVANRNISLTPGPNSAPKIPDGGRITTDQTTTPVDLDQLFNAFEPKTRKGLQQLLQGFSQWYVGQGQHLAGALKYFSPALATTAELARELSADQKVFTDFVVKSSRVVTALASRRDDLTGFVSNTNTVFKAIADQNAQLDQTLKYLPGTLRKANTTFVELRGALNDLDKLTNATKPVAPQLAPFFRQLNGLITTARPTFHDFALMINKAGGSNDLTDVLRNLPALARVTRTSFPNGVKSLQQGQHVIDFIRPYATEFAGWLTKFGQGFAYYDANGHYVRIQAIYNAFQFTPNGGNGTLTPATPEQRRNVVADRGNNRRCPGGATQPAPDGSSPFTDGGKLTLADCNPAARPPGP